MRVSAINFCLLIRMDVVLLSVGCMSLVIFVVILALCVTHPSWVIDHLNFSPSSPSDPGPGPGPGAGGPLPTLTIDGSGFKNLGLKGGQIPAIVQYQGLNAFMVVYQAGDIHPHAASGGARMNPAGIFPCDACTASWKMWFADNFDWTARPGHSVGGKLGGFEIGYGAASGSDFSTTGASLRLTFHTGATALAYLYPQLKQNFTNQSDLPWSTLDQSQEVQQNSVVHAGIHLFERNALLSFKKGQWNDVKLYIKLNDPGKYNGIMSLTVNGQTQTMTTVRYRYDSQTRITDYNLSTFFGGSSKAFAPQATTQAYFAAYSFSV